MLAELAEEERPIAEEVLRGGVPALRQKIEEQNLELRAEGKPEIKPEPLVALAENLLPKLRIAEWRDRAEAALAHAEEIDLRDLRSVVAAASDAARDDSTRDLAAQLRTALNQRQDREFGEWLNEIGAALSDARVVRALRLSSRPPKAGVPFPVEVATRLAEATSASLTADATTERWIAVLDALALAPVRSLVVPASLPAEPSSELLAAVARFGSQLPKLASIFGVVPLPPPKVSRGPRRPPKPTTKPAAKSAPRPPKAAAETPAEETHPAPEAPVEETPSPRLRHTERHHPPRRRRPSKLRPPQSRHPSKRHSPRSRQPMAQHPPRRRRPSKLLPPQSRHQSKRHSPRLRQQMMQHPPRRRRPSKLLPPPSRHRPTSTTRRGGDARRSSSRRSRGTSRRRATRRVRETRRGVTACRSRDARRAIATRRGPRYTTPPRRGRPRIHPTRRDRSTGRRDATRGRVGRRELAQLGRLAGRS